jgi:hypothetical protein
MARIYENKEKELHTLLSKAANDSGATVLIPDLQRPDVWSPWQVVLLIDSLLRGLATWHTATLARSSLRPLGIPSALSASNRA